MHRFVVAALAAVCITPVATADTIRFTSEMGQIHATRESAGVTDPTVTIQFDPVFMDLETVAASEGVTNPLYEGKTKTGNNPLYNGGNRNLLASDVASIEITFGALTWSLHPDNIVHRDIATRNVLLTTNFGAYSNDLTVTGDTWTFGSDGPKAHDAGPLRWMAPESLRLYLNGDVNATDWIDIDPFFYFDSTPVPAPAAAPLLALGALAIRKRRPATG